VVTAPQATIADGLPLDDRTYAVVTTYTFADDRPAGQSRLDAGVPYLRLVGPRERLGEMLEAFEPESDPLREGPIHDRVDVDSGTGAPVR